MEKEFDKWNENKKEIQKSVLTKLYGIREVWWCSLGINIGFEQDGTGKDYERPVLIIKGYSKQVCLVVPLTTSTKKNPYHISVGKIDGRDAFAIFSQLRLIDTKRLINKVAVVDKVLFKSIKKAIKDML